MSETPADRRHRDQMAIHDAAVRAEERTAERLRQEAETAAEFEEAWVTARRTTPTGQCPECGRNFRLRSNGTIWNHGNGVTGSSSPRYRQNCSGAGKQPRNAPA